MKPIIYAALSALLAIGATACSADDPIADTALSGNDSGNVTFNVGCDDVKTESRGTVTTLDNLKVKCLRVFANKTGNGTVFLDQMPLFFYNNVWYLQNTKYEFYTNTSALAFYAWGPYIKVLDTTNPSTKGVSCSVAGSQPKVFSPVEYTQSTKTLKLPGFTQNSKVSQHVDLLVGGDKAPTLVTNATTKKKDLNVKFNMQHALAQVKFKAYVPNKVLRIEIAGIRLTNVYKTGDIILAPGNFVSGKNQEINLAKAWSHGAYSSANLDSYYINLDEYDRGYMTVDGFTNPSSYFSKNLEPVSGGDMLVIPYNYSAANFWAGTSSTTGARISLLCRVSTLDRNDGRKATQVYPRPRIVSGQIQEDDGAKGEANERKFAFASVPLNIELKGGVCNVITIAFNGAGRIDPDQSRPSESSVTPVADPYPGKSKGAPVLNHDIEFSVDYQAWQDGGKAVNNFEY